MADYSKLLITLRSYLVGARYYTALKALDLARNSHGSQMRKDNKTPFMIHPVQIALYITTLKDVINEEITLSVALLHDVREDCPSVTYEEIEKRCGFEVADRCEILNKHGKTYDKYFKEIGDDCITSIVKGADRINNVNSMIGVFSKDKQKKYVDEINHYFLPMLKHARNTFPEQMQAYFNIIHMLRSQVYLLQELK